MPEPRQTGRRAPVAVTGIGCISAAGRNLATTMESMFRGHRAPHPPSCIAIEHDNPYPVFEIPDDWLSDPGGMATHGRCGALALQAVHAALDDAGLDARCTRSLRIGVCLGTVVGAALADGEFFARYHRRQYPAPTPALRFVRNNPAAVVQRRLGVRGPCQTVTTACTSGAAAVAVAASWVRGGLCDVAIAGGAEALSHLSYNGFIALRLADPEPCRPFDRFRRGLNLGEGAAALVLESPGAAARRGAAVRSLLVGDGNASDAHHLSRPEANARGLRLAVREALAAAGRDPSQIAFVNAHGTGTAENDPPEGRALADLVPAAPFHSTKCYTGHTLGAAGAMEAVFSIACLEQGRIPATAGFTEIDPEIGAAPVTTATEVTGTVALSTSVGYGGNNVALVFSRNVDV